MRKFTVFAYLPMLKVFYFLLRYFMNSCCTSLQTHVWIEIDLVCFQGKIDGCSRNVGMKMDTFIDFITTWINLPRQKISENTFCPIHQIDIPPAKILSSKSVTYSKVLSERVLLSNNSIWGMSCYLRARVLLSKEQSVTVNMANMYRLDWRIFLVGLSILFEIKKGSSRPPFMFQRGIEV